MKCLRKSLVQDSASEAVASGYACTMPMRNLPPNPERISHRHIEVFRALMLAGSATGAAQMLFTSQPTISRELARQEQLLGYDLFERVQGRLKPRARALRLWDEVQRSWPASACCACQRSATRCCPVRWRACSARMARWQ